ncbi:MAG TPA: phosphoenolpyruvate--protein phosphotransferase [bacterium]|jgi:phosphoenolpyruvate-protein phosphotransferase|nr:phosphoenolpyruvate--protein phosphotransferase [bacterium]
MSLGSSTSLQIFAPLSGVLVPLDSVPDPVFAQKMAGDGVSIDPTSTELLAPVAGTVTQIHGANHALTITSAEGVEILMHIGLETVGLKGQGFTRKAQVGDRVSVGQVLISFDPVAVGLKAKSLLTQVLVSNGEKVSSLRAAAGLVRAGKDPILSLVLAKDGAGAGAAQGKGPEILSEPVAVPNQSGLHARPAAMLTQAAKKFVSSVKLVRGSDEANARSVVAILGLGVRHGDLLRVKASGPDAQAAVDSLSRLLASGSGEKAGAPEEALVEAQRKAPANAKEFTGVAAAPGSAVGKVWRFRPQNVEVPEFGLGPSHERPILEAALRNARAQIEDIRSGMGEGPKATILGAHLELLEDPDLESMAMEAVLGGKSAGFAWRQAYAAYATQLEGMDNARLRERAGDIRDVGQRVLLLIAGSHKGGLEVPAGSVLVAEEVSPSDAAQLDPTLVLGLCTTSGGATSHVAILARSLGIPAICGMDQAVLGLADGTLVTLDGSSGVLHVDPSAEELAAARERIARAEVRRGAEKAAAHQEARTKDGALIEVAANITSAAEARAAAAAGADGVGLLRTEFLFHDRAEAPAEAEQAAEYRAIAEALGRTKKLVVRTLDVGGDKPLSYLRMPREDNPFLGLRGLRVCLEHPDLFRTQLRAILAAAPFGDLHIMFPMVASLDELKAAKRMLREEERATGQKAKVGVMIEVPSAALTADRLAQEADFFSIGTNDLTQYCLAMDRGNSKLAKRADALHPGVLKLISLAVEGAHRHGRWVGVCGGIASDVLAVPVLIGLGVDELSVSVPAIAGIKARVSTLDKGACQALAQEALGLGTAEEVRARLGSFA